MSPEELNLVEPSLALGAAFWALLEDFRAAGEIHHVPGSGAGSELATLAREALPDFIRRLDEQSRDIGLPPGYVPASSFWLVRRGDGAMVGVSSLRHRLTPALEDVGGHIGYSIRPSERCKGYGTCLLALTMEQARTCRAFGLPCSCPRMAARGPSTYPGSMSPVPKQRYVQQHRPQAFCADDN